VDIPNVLVFRHDTSVGLALLNRFRDFHF